MLRTFLFSTYLIFAISTPLYYFGSVFLNVTPVESPVIYNNTNITLNRHAVLPYKHTLLYAEGNCIKEIYTVTDDSLLLYKWLKQNLTITAYVTPWGYYCDRISLDRFYTFYTFIGIVGLAIWTGFMSAFANSYFSKLRVFIAPDPQKKLL
jgi:hypothetical protein